MFSNCREIFLEIMLATSVAQKKLVHAQSFMEEAAEMLSKRKKGDKPEIKGHQ